MDMTKEQNILFNIQNKYLTCRVQHTERDTSLPKVLISCFYEQETEFKRVRKLCYTLSTLNPGDIKIYMNKIFPVLKRSQ